MIIGSVHVKNFRSILDGTLECDRLTALVGRNGAGKSSFLRAIELFYEPSAKVTEEDFYAEDTNADIEIAITFIDISKEAKDFFSYYIDNDTLTIVRVFSLSPGKKLGTYHGMRLQNPDFHEVRTAGGKTDIRNQYNELRQKEDYSSLQNVRSADQALEELEKWESENVDKCVRMRDDGQFFGFTEVGRGYLGRHTRFIRIPAVRDAAEDSIEKRGSFITEIMDIVVRSTLARRKELISFKEGTQRTYQELMDPSRLTELKTLETQLTGTLQSYAPDTGVSLLWSNLSEIDIPMPQAQVKLIEDGYETSVLRTGHGLQRAYILTMLQHLVAARVKETDETENESEDEITEVREERTLPSLALAIEEPELYQHPSRQRHFASVFLKLAAGVIPGVAENTQIFYTTHAPLFVGLDRFDQVRLLMKEKGLEDNKPKVTKVSKAELSKVAEEIWIAKGKEGEMFTEETMRPRLQSIMTPWMNEGFFADVVVLVEGEDDRAAILGTSKALNKDFDSAGISVIPCMGKNNIDRPLTIFKLLGIPFYVIWDSDQGDKDSNPAENRYLLRLLGQTEEDWPNKVGEQFACFKVNLETTLEEEIGKEMFEEYLSEIQKEFGIAKKEQALKNPLVIQSIIEKVNIEGKNSSTLNKIIENIMLLKS